MKNNINNLGEEMFALIKDLFPICRSITGNGVRLTLKKIAEIIPLKLYEVKSGTGVLDWTIPLEWNIEDAYVQNSKGEKIIDFNKNNLHILNYSLPVDKTLSLQEMLPHLFSIPEHPDWIPYRTSYYNANWGFCITHKMLQELKEKSKDEQYKVVIKSSLTEGSLTYGQYYHQGETNQEIIFSCHICHPSLANDNLSAMAVNTFLANSLKNKKTRYSYRFLFIPGTIGSIAWLANNKDILSNIKHGLVLACLGDSGLFNYKRSRQKDAKINDAMEICLRDIGYAFKLKDFIPYGYDERQFCSPGFNLPFGCLTRTPDGEFPEYHSSADNLSFINNKNLNESLNCCLNLISILENNYIYLNLAPYGEPQLGKRGLYDAIGGSQHSKTLQMALLWILNLSDGRHSLLDIAKQSGIAFNILNEGAGCLKKAGLLKVV